MVGLWDIAIGNTNPDGTPKGSTVLVKTEKDTGKESSDGPKEETTETNVATGMSTAEIPSHQPQSDEPSSEDVDSKVYFEYETVDDKQVMVSKRTKYRVWRQFENGTHSTFWLDLIIMPNPEC
jgi:hypothetical protein